MSLLSLQGNAVRHHGIVEVTLTGQLSDTCSAAEISGATSSNEPPGTGRIEIKTGKRPGSGACLQVLVPWFRTTSFADDGDTEVEVFVDGTSTLAIPILGKPVQYVVYRHLNNENTCIIVPEDANVLAIYTRVFGPASRDACEKFVAEHCKGAGIKEGNAFALTAAPGLNAANFQVVIPAGLSAEITQSLQAQIEKAVIGEVGGIIVGGQKLADLLKAGNIGNIVGMFPAPMIRP